MNKFQHRLPCLLIAATSGLLLCLGTSGRLEASDFAGNGATGFGGTVGLGSLKVSDDGTTLTGVITRGGAAFNDNLVLYIDSQSGGFADTSGFADGADALRCAISGFDGGTNRSTLTFPSGFTADYAIALGPNGANFGGLWSLANGGSNSLSFVTGVSLTPTGNGTAASYSFSLPVSQLGLTPNSGASFRIIGTYVSSTGYRSNEALPGNVTGTQGWNAFTASGPVTHVTSRVVTTTSDSGAGSLRQVVSSAVAGDRILISPSLSGQTCTLTSGQILLNKNLTIDASALSAGFTISGNNSSRVFEVAVGKVVTLRALAIRDGYASGTSYPGNTGGGIFNSGTLTLTECTLSSNRAVLGADPGGGGIENSDGVLTLNRCTVSGNSSTYGGGIENYPGTLVLNQCTIANNSATLNGGGISSSGGSITVNQSTICGNSGGTSFGSGGGGIGVNVGTMSLSNSIVAQNTATAGPNILGSYTSGGVNFVTGNPQLSSLSNNGGPTLTMVPQNGSPVINAGGTTSFSTDQRGLPIVGAPDIGAAEYQGSGNAALIAVWNLDSDGDGKADGIEYALGTNPSSADASNSRNLTPPTRNGSGANVLAFGLNPNAAPGTRWILQRSTNLAPGSFTDIYTFDGTTDTTANGISVVRTTNGVTVTDASAPSGKGFYRFKATIE